MIWPRKCRWCTWTIIKWKEWAFLNDIFLPVTEQNYTYNKYSTLIQILINNKLRQIADNSGLDEERVRRWFSEKRKSKSIQNAVGCVRGAETTFDVTKMANIIAGKDLSITKPSVDLPLVRFCWFLWTLVIFVIKK